MPGIIDRTSVDAWCCKRAPRLSRVVGLAGLIASLAATRCDEASRDVPASRERESGAQSTYRWSDAARTAALYEAYEH
jgi:hypothetical protein